MNQRDLVERGVDRAMRLSYARVSDGYLDEGAEEWPAPPDVSA
jgi:hypothetical protein